jgi:NAD(P)H dehydrogenase (quinone)
MQNRKKERAIYPSHTPPAIAVTAASGKLGCAIARTFSAHGLAGNVRLTARNPEKLHPFHREGFDTVAADYENGRSMAAAFAGIDVAFIISSMGPDVIRIRQHRIAIDAAIAAGVKRIVYTSSANAMNVGPMQWTYVHANTEHYLQNCGIPCTILRVGAYFSNFNYLFQMAMQCHRLFFPNIAQPISLITQEDVAAAAFAVLTKPGHDKKVYEILATESASITNLAQIMTRILGTRVVAAEIPVEAFVAQLRKHGLSADVTDLLGAFYTVLSSGEFARTSKDMEILTGRPTTSAGSYLNTFINSA